MTENVNRNRHLDSLNETTPHTYLDARSVNNNQRDQDYDGQIVYPDTRTTCTHGLCTNVVGYPKDRIKKLLSRSQFMNGYFEATEELVNIDNRFGSDEMSLCDTMVHTIYPEKANNTNKIEKVIVNVEGHKQGIVFETCVNNEKCKFSSTFPNGYISYCKQKYIHKRLMVLGDNDKFVFDSFEVPSCCVCTVKKDN
ncbi:hypothetical protein BDFB_002821 [Asbolus verrucosus]|uniref:Spaetzle domain-containing protein n=1 Tax=Asbolus verrucosus TaxID=1661398 RepID=A0A482V6S3_ASBVE|nr:hypothetical protein BDFB_002821 [Asbolus verrucosus]